MKAMFVIVIYLFFFEGIPKEFTQSSISLPQNLLILGSKYNNDILGKNVFLFDPTMDMKEIQAFIDSLHSYQTTLTSEFSENRFALLFKPGAYRLDVRVGYYMHIMGLGNSPEDVTIIGAVRSNSMHGGHVLTNFWRTAENLTIVPTVDSTNTWAVSQAAPLHRVYVKGNLKLHDGPSSGGFMADCKIDGTVFSGSQQQWLSRNTFFKKWEGYVWNMMFLGDTNAPEGNWPNPPFTTIKETPEIREKPYWVLNNGKYILKLPTLKKNSVGIDWALPNKFEKSIPIEKFYIALPNAKNAELINDALKEGKHILFTPGIYSLKESLKITHPGTIVVGIGMATLVPVNGNKAIEVADVDEVTIASLLIDASHIPSKTLIEIGEMGSNKNHTKKPTFLYDLFFRVGGSYEASTSNCLMINSNNVFVDHSWLWRADHGKEVGWYKNKSPNGLIVNANDVTIYGLFNEHFQEYQTIWNGENGRVYFYQSEMPYDPPSSDAWKHGNTLGFASYKVADHVKKHSAWGIGIYSVFSNPPIYVDQVIETPLVVENTFYHKVIVWLGSKSTTGELRSIINGKGGSANAKNKKSILE